MHYTEIAPEKDWDSPFIRKVKHPTEDLYILNYTKAAPYTKGAFDNPAVRAARGLIINGDGQVIARPFDKFFNYGQEGAPQLSHDTPVYVSDKLDGSLGILYWTSDGKPAIATRGSFTSEMALHATELVQREYPELADLPRDYTYMFEIIYPENRIVVDYGDTDDIVLIGTRVVDNGGYLDTLSALKMLPSLSVTRDFGLMPLSEALTIKRENAEGVVLRTMDDQFVKVKQEDYLELHRAVSNFSKRFVWEKMAEGNNLYDILDPLPDEFHDLARQYWNELDRAWCALDDYLQEEWYDLPHSTFTSRKDLALYIKDHPHKDLLFMISDDKFESLNKAIWKLIKP